MSRKFRRLSGTNIYHVVIRGIDRQSIFTCEKDNIFFIYLLKKYIKKCGYRIFAYCLMNNHLHILLKTEAESISKIMKRISSSYVLWYNRNYERCGHLFQGRFYSEPVEKSSYLFSVIKYIHMNPVKGGIVNRPEDYRWSSYIEYLDDFGISEREPILKLFNDDRQKALIDFKALHYSDRSDPGVLDINNSYRPNDDSAAKIIMNLCNIKSPKDITLLEDMKKNNYINILFSEYNLSIRQLSRLTGISREVLKVLTTGS